MIVGRFPAHEKLQDAAGHSGVASCVRPRGRGRARFIARATRAQTAQKSAEDDEIWDIIKDTTDASLLQSFLEGFPNSRHAAAAQARLAAVTASKPPTAATAPTPPPATASKPPAATVAPTPPPATATKPPVATVTPATPPATTPKPPAAGATPLLPPVTIPAPASPPSGTATQLRKLFPEPRQGQDGSGNMRVDWCLNWAANCGKPAAEAFCQARGFRQATSFQSQQTGGPTWVAGDRKICLQPACTAPPPSHARARPRGDRGRSWKRFRIRPSTTCRSRLASTRSATAASPRLIVSAAQSGSRTLVDSSKLPAAGRSADLGDGANCLGCRALKGVICSRGG